MKNRCFQINWGEKIPVPPSRPSCGSETLNNLKRN
uniref:Uncharacterized protein n=1 Tax=Anguilla anguilla TaxID=7936 RepID=A0A0E9TK62_ANGAN